jgi:hypothetical protein
MEAPGGVEPPTNGLGNRGFHSSLGRMNNLLVGLGLAKWAKSHQTAVIWQPSGNRFWTSGSQGSRSEHSIPNQ